MKTKRVATIVSLTFLIAGIASAEPKNVPFGVSADATRSLERVQPMSSTGALITSETLQRIRSANPDDRIDVIVTLSPDRVAASADDAEAASAATLVFSRAASPIGFVSEFSLRSVPVVGGSAPARAVPDLAKLPNVIGIEIAGSKQLLRVQGSKLIRSAEFGNSVGGRGKGIGIAIVDSGVDWTHPELAGRVASQANYTDEAGDGSDVDGHGTAIAGIIATVAPDAHMHAYRACTAESCPDKAILRALDSAYVNRSGFGGTKVVNLSLGAGAYDDFCDSASPAYTAAIQKLVSVGIVVFAASGNEGLNRISHPACMTQTISVGAVYDGDIGGPRSWSSCTDSTTGADRIPCYSNSGKALDILAPSHCATTTGRNKSQVQCFGGTSAASPYAAAATAQLLSARPATPNEILQALFTSGKPITDVNGITRARVDVPAAHDRLVAIQTSPVPVAPSHLSAESTGATTATLRWRDNSPNEESFIAYFSANGSAFKSFGSPSPANTTSMGVINLTPGVAYRFRITAKNAGGESVPSNVAELGGSPACSPCVSSTNTACLLGNRFKITLPAWYDPFAKISGQGTVLRYAENREEVHPTYGPLGATSFFSFYAHAPNSIEVTLRMFKGAGINDRYWVFMSGFTGADYTIRVEDTRTCKVWQRTVPSGATNVVKDYEAFPFP
jgi:subtilisin family serine protease